MNNPKIVDFKGANRTYADYVKAIKEAKKKGHDGAILKNTFDPMSDDIYDWFINVYEPTNDPDAVLYNGDVFNSFTSSKYYENLSKKEKRDNNLKNFSMKVDKCSFLTKNLKKRDTTHNKIKHKKPYIIGFKLIEDDQTTPNPLDFIQDDE